MSTVKVDSKKRVVLPNGQPGDIFEIQQQGEGRFMLVRLEKPAFTERLSRKACMTAMQQTPLHPTIPWERLRKLTREP